jgi:hypothetical protein
MEIISHTSWNNVPQPEKENNNDEAIFSISDMLSNP